MTARWIKPASFGLVAGLHAGALVLLLVNPHPDLTLDEAPAIQVELIKVEAAAPKPPSEHPPGPVQVQTSATVAVQPAPRLRVSAVAPEAVPQPIPDPARRAARPSEYAPIDHRPPATATTAPASRPAPPAAQASSAARDWRSRLLAHLDRNKRYPATAQRLRQEGVVQIRFTLNRQGRVLTSSIAKSSGFNLLDREAMAMLQRAQPLPQPPPEEAGDVIQFVTDVDFFTGH